jgi:phage gp36-like protein
MLYLTLPEFVEYIRSLESVDQSNEDGDKLIVDTRFYQKAIESGSAELESRLGIRFPLPLPLSSQVKFLCYPLAHWWAEKMGNKREWVQVEYEAALASITSIANGTAALIGLDGKPIGAIGGDSSGAVGVQAVGTFVGRRTTEWNRGNGGSVCLEENQDLYRIRRLF